MSVIWQVPLAVFLDALFGEPRRFHPLVGFGRLAETVERGFIGRIFKLIEK
jgi:adenosylcobinamide-phosphate synthase